MLFQHSFQYILQFLKCLENFNMFFNTPWNIQHSFELALQFSTHTEIFNMLFQHSFQHILQFSTCHEIFNMFPIFNIVLHLHYIFQLTLKFSTHFFNMCYSFQEHAEIFNILFLGSLSLQLKPPYSIAHEKLWLAIWVTSFGLFWSNLDTKGLETYPRTYSGHFWNMSIFGDCRAIWVLFRKWVVSENQSFLNEGVIITPLSV